MKCRRFGVSVGQQTQKGKKAEKRKSSLGCGDVLQCQVCRILSRQQGEWRGSGDCKYLIVSAR